MEKNRQKIAGVACLTLAFGISMSHFIFNEIVTVLSQKVGRKIGVAAGEYILTNPTIQIIYIDSCDNMPYKSRVILNTVVNNIY